MEVFVSKVNLMDYAFMPSKIPVFEVERRENFSLFRKDFRFSVSEPYTLIEGKVKSEDIGEFGVYVVFVKVGITYINPFELPPPNRTFSVGPGGVEYFYNPRLVLFIEVRLLEYMELLVGRPGEIPIEIRYVYSHTTVKNTVTGRERNVFAKKFFLKLDNFYSIKVNYRRL